MMYHNISAYCAYSVIKKNKNIFTFLLNLRKSMNTPVRRQSVQLLVWVFYTEKSTLQCHSCSEEGNSLGKTMLKRCRVFRFYIKNS